MEPKLPSDLEAKLAEFLQTMSPVREVMARIVDWQIAHDVRHKALEDRLDSHHFRLQAVEASTWRGRAGLVRLAVAVALAAGVGYAARGVLDPPTHAARP